mgnify:CR=1 FL=1
MKMTNKIIAITAIAFTLFVLAWFEIAQAQEVPFTLPWTVLSAGGGRSTEGDYRFISTIGQPVAGRVSNSGFTLTSGFLGLLSQPSTLPTLKDLFLPLIMH